MAIGSRVLSGAVLCVALSFLGAAASADRDARNGRGRYCTATALTLSQACRAEASDDYELAQALCLNVSDPEERGDCYDEAREARLEKKGECREQLSARRDACDRLGEERYDPELDPEAFEDDFGNPATPNPYFPLGIGSFWRYQSDEEYTQVEVLPETKLIEGITSIVLRDQVFLNNGDAVEDTDDWYALHLDGDVWYMGEEVKDFESFDGDDPRVPELVSIDGSFKHGRDGDKAGLFFPIELRVGDFRREEFSLGNAEDVVEILSTSYAYGQDPELDEGVPEDLAALLCANADCVVTRNTNLMEPGLAARKYYARDVGYFLEVEPGTVLQLVECNVHPLCNALPTP